MALSVQDSFSTPTITDVNGVPTKDAFYQSIYNAPSSTPSSAFYNNPYGVSAQEIDGMQRANAYSPPVQNTGTNTGNNVAPAVNPATSNFLAALPGQLAGIHAGAGAGADQYHSGLNTGVTDLVYQLTKDQNAVNETRQNAELAKRQGTTGVLEMIQRGLQNSGVMLANRNAGNSSAAEALARAYGDMGRRSQSQVGTQYAQAEHGADVAQTDVNNFRTAKVSDLQDQKTQAINTVVAQAQSQLAYLAGQAAMSGTPNSVNMEAERQAIRNEATAKLADLDQMLSSRVGPIGPASADVLRQNAAGLATQGVASSTPYNYTTATPDQLQNTGPFAGELPIFTAPGSKKQGT